MFDTKCFELAEYFLPGAPAETLQALAQEIQDTIEDFDANRRFPAAPKGES